MTYKISKPGLTVIEGNGYPVDADPAIVEALDEESLKCKLLADAEAACSLVVKNNVAYTNGYPKYHHGQKHRCEKCGKKIIGALSLCVSCKSGRTARQNKPITDRSDGPQLSGRHSFRARQKENR